MDANNFNKYDMFLLPRGMTQLDPVNDAQLIR